MYNYNVARWSLGFYGIAVALVFTSCFHFIPVVLTDGEMVMLLIGYLVGHIAIYNWVDNTCFRNWIAAPEQYTNYRAYMRMYGRIKYQVNALGWAVTIINCFIIAGMLCQLAIGVGNAVFAAGIVSVIICFVVARNVVHYYDQWVHVTKENTVFNRI